MCWAFFLSARTGWLAVWNGFPSRGSGERSWAGNVWRNRAAAVDIDFTFRLNRRSGSRNG